MKVQKNVELFKDSYFYRKHKLQALRDSGIRILGDRDEIYTSGDSRIGIPEDSQSSRDNEMSKYTLKDSRIGAPVGIN